MTRNWLRALLVAALGLAALPAEAQAPSGDTGVRIQLPIDAAMQDAGEYARRFGVPLDTALHRMRAQAATIPVTDALRTEFADRLAGIAIEHSPDYRIVVLLTGTDPVADRLVPAGGLDVPIVFRTGAAVPLAVIVARIREHQASIRAALPHPPGIGADQRTGEMVVLVSSADLDLDRDGALTARFAALTGVPVRIEAIDRPPAVLQGLAQAPPNTPIPAANTPLGIPVPGSVDTLDFPLPAVAGGARVVGLAGGRRFACTTGFLVTDGARTALATAAHCPDELAYVGRDRVEIALPYVAQWGWGYHDVQINLAPPTSVPAFYADTPRTRLRTVATWRNRTSTRPGDFVCHRGERTGYSCAPIAMVDFAPAGDLCGGACLPTWVAVEGPTCKAGDSGAPVFDGQVALGLVKGGTYRADGSCLFYYYMSTDYLPPPWRLVYQPVLR